MCIARQYMLLICESVRWLNAPNHTSKKGALRPRNWHFCVLPKLDGHRCADCVADLGSKCLIHSITAHDDRSSRKTDVMIILQTWEAKFPA